MGEGRGVGGDPDDRRLDALDPSHLVSKAGTVRNGSLFRVLIVGMTAALVLGATLGFDGVGTRDATASSGMVITLENEGPSTITEAALGFDLPPIDPGQTLDVRIGDPGSPTDLGELQFNGSSVSRTNPLPPGAIACIGPLPQLVPGTHVDFEEIEWFGNGFSTSPFLAIVIDESVLPFDFAHSAVPGGTLDGTWRFLSTVPPECGPSAPVDPAVTDGGDEVNGTLTDPVGNNGSTTVALPVNPGLVPSSISLVVIMSLVVALAVIPSTAAILVRRRRRKDPDSPGTAS